MDELIESSRARLRVKIGAVIVLALVGLGCAVLASVIGSSGTTSVIQRDAISGQNAGEARPPGSGGGSGSEDDTEVANLGSGVGTNAGAGSIFVHILGAVMNPGLYELHVGERAIDAVAAAGGFTENADRAQLNLARFVADGEQIIVAVIGEAPPVGASVQAGTVNLNTADAATLETLPRVGPEMAARIIAWRDSNGRFTAIEDLKSVSGIGDKTFEGLRELISI